jgi:hypothetical protein
MRALGKRRRDPRAAVMTRFNLRNRLHGAGFPVTKSLEEF